MNPSHSQNHKAPQRPPDPDLRILYWNSDSISGKFDQLKYFISNHQTPNKLIHIIAISEAKLTSKQSPPIIYTPLGAYYPYYFPVISQHNKSKAQASIGGGFLFYVHNTVQNIEFPPELRLSNTTSLSPEQLHTSDIVWANIKYGKSTLKVALGYLNPQAPISVYQAFEDNIKLNLENNKNNTKAIIGGDFNLKHPTWSNYIGTSETGRTKMAEKFSNFIDEQGLIIMNSLYVPNTPTLFPYNDKNNTPSTVDLVLINDPNIGKNLQVLQNSGLLSDHKPLLASIVNSSETQLRNQMIQNKLCFKWASNPSDVDSWIKFVEHINPALTAWIQLYESLLGQTSLNSYNSLPNCRQSTQLLVEEAWRDLQTGIIRSAESIIGKKIVGLNQQIKGFGKYKAEIEELILTVKAKYSKITNYMKNCKKQDKPINVANKGNLQKQYKEAIKNYKNKLKEIQIEQWQQLIDSVYDDSTEETIETKPVHKRFAWGHYKRTVPSAIVYPTNINNTQTGETPIDYDESNENLADYYQSICTINPSKLEERDPAIAQSIKQCNLEIGASWSNMMKTETILDYSREDANKQWALMDEIDPDNDNNQIREVERGSDNPESIFSHKELLSCIKSINCKKAYGPDEIDNSFIKHGGK
jgi:endonuclease/exonuclease/phosphatase family metal-dependent hydrolase